MTESRSRVGPLLTPAQVARLQGLRLTTRRRVTGRYSGAHASKRFGSSLEFADYREYVAGDDPRRVDLAAYRRLGKLLVKLTEAEDEAPVRVVVDQSASMGFGNKARMARQLAAAMTILGTSGQDPVRVLLAGTVDGADQVDPGPWLRGRHALAIASKRLVDQAMPSRSEDDDDDDPITPVDPIGALKRAIHRAHGEGARGPVVLVSDLLFPNYEAVLRSLASGGRGGADAVLVHLVGRQDLDPDIRGDLRLVDAETGADVEVSVDDRSLRSYFEARDAWLDDIDAIAGRHAITVVRVVDDEDLDEVVLTGFRAAGVVA